MDKKEEKLISDDKKAEIEGKPVEERDEALDELTKTCAPIPEATFTSTSTGKDLMDGWVKSKTDGEEGFAFEEDETPLKMGEWVEKRLMKKKNKKIIMSNEAGETVSVSEDGTFTFVTVGDGGSPNVPNEHINSTKEENDEFNERMGKAIELLKSQLDEEE